MGIEFKAKRFNEAIQNAALDLGYPEPRHFFCVYSRSIEFVRFEMNNGRSRAKWEIPYPRGLFDPDPDFRDIALKLMVML